MNVYLNNFCHYSMLCFEERILPILNNQQKKILIVASIALGFLVTCFIVRRFCLEDNELEDDKLNDQGISIEDRLNSSKSTGFQKEEKKTFEECLRKNQYVDDKIKKTTSPIVGQKDIEESGEEILDSLETESLQDLTRTVYPILYSNLLQPHQLREIQDIRQPLTHELKNYFDLDTYGYIFQPKSTLSLQYIEKELANKEKALAHAFYQVSREGDAAYADDVRTVLAGLNIASIPVDKDAQQIEGKTHDLNTTRPVSYVKSKGKAPGTNPPGIYKKTGKFVPAYIDMWGNAIWKGNRDYRHSFGSSYKTHDKKLTPQQIMDYHHRLHRIRVLHKEGLLLGRVANIAEVKDFIGHRHQHPMGNDILSTTLLPKERDHLIMQLFNGSFDDIGLLFDHTRVGSEDFGVSFHVNGGTSGTGFQNHKKRRKKNGVGYMGIQGAHSILIQKTLLEALSTEVKQSGTIRHLNISLSDDGSHYRLNKFALPSQVIGFNTDEKVAWNEQTFYRGIEKDFLAGLFLKSNSSSFSNQLKLLVELQDRIRRKRGMYIPIFKFKDSSNELEELVPDNIKHYK